MSSWDKSSGTGDRSGAGRGAAPGRLLAGRYLLTEFLGRGGMGTVWRAQDQVLGRDVAVKELTVSGLSPQELEVLHSRMEQEARAAARVKHPAVVTVFDVLTEDGRPWIVMELIDGRSLADIVDTEGTLLPRDAARVGAQLASALDRAHQLGVLHRDIKPANVLLERGGRVVLTDFGIALLEGSPGLTRTGDVVGSPDYLAPERATGHRPGPESDVWSLGVTLYAAVEGLSPFRRATTMSTLQAVVSEPLPEPRHAGPLAPVLGTLLDKDPTQRPSADEARRMLEAVAADTPPTARVPAYPPTQAVVPDDLATYPTQSTPPTPTTPLYAAPPPPPPPPQQPARRRRPVLLIVAGAVAAALIAGGASYAALSSRHTPVASTTTTSASAAPTTAASQAPPTTAPTTAAAPAPPTSQPPPTTAAPTDPATVVTEYFSAINAHDYQRAWDLGGKNVQSGSFSSFVQGFSTTAADTVTIVSTTGDTVSMQLDAAQTDGTHQLYAGTYTVQNGVITAASVHPLP